MKTPLVINIEKENRDFAFIAGIKPGEKFDVFGDAPEMLATSTTSYYNFNSVDLRVFIEDRDGKKVLAKDVVAISFKESFSEGLNNVTEVVRGTIIYHLQKNDVVKPLIKNAKNIHITFVNEHGEGPVIVLNNIRITSWCAGLSTDDLLVEAIIEFQATGVNEWQESSK